MMVAYYSVFKPWFYKRIYATVRNAFADNLKIFLFDNNYLFNACIMAGKSVEGFVAEPSAEAKLGGGIPSTDDWPYIYLERPTITALYFKVFGVVAVCVLIAFFVLKREQAATGFHLDFFFLGVGFTLLEAAAIVRLTLAFGTTWIVSAVVFFAALLMIFLSNLLVMRLRISVLRWAWAGVLIFLATNYLFPVQWLLSAGTPLRVLLSILLIGSPVFCAGVWFSSLFTSQTRSGYTLGINLIGAMIGGLLEYASMLTGMRQVWLLIILVYIAALFASLGKTYRSRANMVSKGRFASGCLLVGSFWPALSGCGQMVTAKQTAPEFVRGRSMFCDCCLLRFRSGRFFTALFLVPALLSSFRGWRLALHMGLVGVMLMHFCIC